MLKLLVTITIYVLLNLYRKIFNYFSLTLYGTLVLWLILIQKIYKHFCIKINHKTRVPSSVNEKYFNILKFILIGTNIAVFNLN